MMKNKIEKVSIDFSLDMMDKVILFLFSDSDLLTRKNVSNINKLFNIMDERIFENDNEVLMRIKFIQRVSYGFCKKNIRDIQLLFDFGINCTYKNELSEEMGELINSNYQLKQEEIKYINNMVSEKLKYVYLYKYKDIICDDFEKLEIGDYNSLEEINEEIRNDLMKLLNNIRKSKAEDNANDYDFELNDTDSYQDVISKTFTSLKNPSNKLKTGVKYLNKMLYGGFECGRVYLFLATSGGFKSGLLLSCANWIRKYNPQLKPNDPKKIPTVLYLSQENSVKETIQRLYLMETGREMEKEKNLDEVFINLKNAGVSPENNLNINLAIKYQPNKSISTDDLYNIIEDFEDRGREVICLIQDYIKRIRPSNPTKDLRLDLGNIVDEFCVLAKEKNIPVISASQLNRNAFKIIETAAQSGKLDAGKLLNASDAGESMLMIENSDWTGIINQEYKQIEGTDYKFLSIKEVKRRGNKIVLDYFAHPFEEKNWLKLIEDEYATKSSSVLELSDTLYVDTPEEIDNVLRESKGKKTSRTLKKKLNMMKKFNSNNKTKEIQLDDYDYLNNL